MCRQCRRRGPSHQYVPRPNSCRFPPYIWIAAFKSGIKPCTYRRLESSKMKFIGALAAALTLAGRHGTLLAATSIFVGLAVPRLAAACKPFLRSEERRVGQEAR